MKAFRIFAELRRRRVLRVVGVYAVGAWAAIEVSATVFPLLHLPEWTVTFVVGLALLGLPVASILAWLYDLTPAGVIRTPADGVPVTATATEQGSAPQRGLAGRAAGFFGLGMLVALVSVAAYFRFGPAYVAPVDATGIESIAVLPFADMSERGDQTYFADGMTEELLDRLAHVEGLRVAARTSSFAFRDRDEDVKQIALRLGVESILEGSIRRDGDRLRVTAQLIDARTGYHLWSETYDREVASVFTIQDEISTAIVDALRMQFAGSDPGAASRTGNVRAHDLYLQGMLRLHQRTEAGLRQAIGYFEQSLAEDPEYAPAWAGLAQTYAVLPSISTFPVEEAIGSGAAAAARALAIDATLAEAHAALGQIAQSFEWNFPDAERAYRRAIEYNPAYATAHQWYAESLLLLGRLDAAEDEIDRAIRIDPLSPSAMSVRAYLLAVRGRSDAAREAYRSVTELFPDNTLAALNRALLAVHMRRTDDAAAIATVAMGGDTTAAAAVRSLASRGSGPDDAAIRAAAQLDSRHTPALASLWFAAVGDRETALDRIEQAVAEHSDPNLPFILLHPILRPLGDDPRFMRLIDEVGVVLPANG